MTATLEFQQGLFDQPFTPAEIRSAGYIASYLPDACTLSIERSPVGQGILLKASVRFTGAVSLQELPLGDEHEIGTELAGLIGKAARDLAAVLP